jgi:CBS-domain-containing membrane protein
MVDSLLKGVRARDLMTREYETVPSSLSVQGLVDDYILKHKERVFLVQDGDDLKGIVCLEDVKGAPKENRAGLTVADIMTPREKLQAVTPEDDGRSILNSLTSKNIHQVPVMEEGRVTGIICRTDILRFIQLKRDLGA